MEPRSCTVCSETFTPKRKTQTKCQPCIKRLREGLQLRRNERFKRLNRDKALEFDGIYDGPEVAGVPILSLMTVYEDVRSAFCGDIDVNKKVNPTWLTRLSH